MKNWEEIDKAIAELGFFIVLIVVIAFILIGLFLFF